MPSVVLFSKLHRRRPFHGLISQPMRMRAPPGRRVQQGRSSERLQKQRKYYKSGSIRLIMCDALLILFWLPVCLRTALMARGKVTGRCPE
jgi:hypothetical protein